ncbi:hypothetical protein, partial [Glaesserella parasuis]|uniref:hypothetical protein n=1 Tax=Glaesserella parasuis TaxID=738 RepID=UPI002436B702
MKILPLVKIAFSLVYHCPSGATQCVTVGVSLRVYLPRTQAYGVTHSSVAPPLDYIGWQRHPIMLNRLRQSRCRG